MKTDKNTTVIPQRYGSKEVAVFKHLETNELIVIETHHEISSYTCDEGFTIERLDDTETHLMTPLGTFQRDNMGESHSYIEYAMDFMGNKYHPYNDEYMFNEPLAFFVEKKGYRWIKEYTILTDSFDLIDEAKLEDL